MAEALLTLLVAFIGLAGGIAVGSGFVAFIVVLDIVPRLAQLANGYRHSFWFESAIIGGAVFWTVAEFFGRTMELPVFPFLPAVGLLDGVFVGLLAAALTEVINVLPILAKRLKLGDYLVVLLAAMILGKVTGSLFDWLVYQH